RSWTLRSRRALVMSSLSWSAEWLTLVGLWSSLYMVISAFDSLSEDTRSSTGWSFNGCGNAVVGLATLTGVETSDGGEDKPLAERGDSTAALATLPDLEWALI